MATGNSRVQRRLVNGTWEAWGAWGAGIGQFKGPSGVAVDGQGNVYVADTGNNRIQRRLPDGTWEVSGETWGAGIGQFKLPRGVAVDSLDNVYIADLAESYATFKWSRDNGTVIFRIDEDSKLVEENKVRVSALGRDQALALREGDTIEVLGDDTELAGEPGILTEIKPDGVDRARRELTLESEVSVYVQQDHPKVRRWDQTETEARTLKDGARKVEEGQEIELEDGVKIVFEPGGSEDIDYRSSDYWVFAVRAATGEVQSLSQAPPQGIRHHYCPLALVKWTVNADGTATISDGDIRDCRTQFRFRPLSEQPATTESFFYLGGDGQEAIPGEELLQPLRVGLLKGGRPPDLADNRRVVFHIEAGGGELRKVGNVRVEPYDSVTVEVDEDGVAQCSWRLDKATQNQRVRAVVEGGSQGIVFTASLGLGRHGTDNPFAGTIIDGPVVFGRSSGALGSTYGGQKLALRWDALRNVGIEVAPTPRLAPIFVYTWGSQQGAGNGEFNRPLGVAVHLNSGDIYVADQANHRIQKFDSDGNFITTWGGQGTGDRQFRNPGGVAAGREGDIYVADFNNHRIHRYVETSGNLSTGGNLFVYGGSVDVKGGLGQLGMEGNDVTLRLRDRAMSSNQGGLCRIRLHGGTLSFEMNTAQQGDFSSAKVGLQIKSDGTLSVPTQKGGYVVDYFISRADDTVEQGDVIIAATDTSHYYGMDDSIPLPEATVTEDAYDSRVCGVVAEVVTENNLPYVEVRAPEADHVAGEVRATDAAERRAEELGISLSDVVGTGSGGRILVADVDAAMENGSRGVELEPHAHPLARFAGEITPESDATKVEDQQMGTMVTLGAYAHCKVDADIAPISVGDLLTTSRRKGHAQKVLEREKAVGAIVGKALASLDQGRGKIPVLVMLQ